MIIARGALGPCRLTSLGLLSILVATIGHTESAFELRLPIDCELRKPCVIQNYVDHDLSRNSSDFACGTLTYDGHNGTDFRLPTTKMQRAGVNVLAAQDGFVTRIRDGVLDISGSAMRPTDVTGRECGNGVVITHRDGWETQYCHMQIGIRVKPEQRVGAGDILGAVGLSGRTEFPHLHFTVRHDGKIVDPFAYGAPETSCEGGVSLWHPALRESMKYEKRAVLNSGFSSGPVTMDQIELDEFTGPQDWTVAPAIIAYVRAIGLQSGDTQSLSIHTPSGKTFAERVLPALDRSKAQVMLFVGAKRANDRWVSGTYSANYVVMRDGTVVLEKRFLLVL